jgi:hypothetical protein
MCIENECDIIEYDKDWNLLMPVIEKIESLGFWTKIGGFYTFNKKHTHKQCSIKKQDPNSEGDYIYDDDGDWMTDKRECVYIAIVNFVKWYKEI